MTDNDVIFLTSRMEINVAPDDKSHFKYVVHVMPKWIFSVRVTFKYLINIAAQVA